MSQEFTKREPSRFQPELDANKLCAYTTHILVNRKYFPEEIQQTFVPKLIDLVLQIAEKVNEANEVSVKPSLEKNELKSNYAERVKLENEALELLKTLKSRIKILKLGYHLASHKANAWTREVNKVIITVTNWKNSETRKYKELG